MKFSRFMEHARRVAPNIEPPIVADMLRSIIDETGALLWGLKFIATTTTKSDSVEYLFSEFEWAAGSPATNLISLDRFWMDDERVRQRGNAAGGDVIFDKFQDKFYIGRMGGYQLSPIGGDKTLYMQYNGQCPEISTAEDSEPFLPVLHMAFVYRLQADLYAEVSQWDRVGYFRRRFEDAVDKHKKLKGSGDGEYFISANPIPSMGVYPVY